jgi:hypothetical protein
VIYPPEWMSQRLPNGYDFFLKIFSKRRKNPSVVSSPGFNSVQECTSNVRF